MIPPKVRISPNYGQWLLCVSVECGVQLARRYELGGHPNGEGFIKKVLAADVGGILNEKDVRRAFTYGSETTKRDPYAVIYFRSGWVETPGPQGMTVWRMSPRARERFLRGRVPAYRRRPADYDEDTRPDKPWVLDDRGRRNQDVPGNWAVNARQFPALVICPRCGRQQMMTDDVLAVTERSA